MNEGNSILIGLRECYIGEDGKITGSFTRIISQDYYYLVFSHRIVPPEYNLDRSIFTEVIQISEETEQTVDLSIITSVYAHATITRVETFSRNRQTATGFFDITNTNNKVRTTFVSGGRPKGKNAPSGIYDILAKTNVGYRLEARDKKYGNDWIDGTNQGLIRLHALGRGNTYGCISIENNWNAIDKLIQESVFSYVTVRRTYFLRGVNSEYRIERIDRGSESIKNMAFLMLLIFELSRFQNRFFLEKKL